MGAKCAISDGDLTGFRAQTGWVSEQRHWFEPIADHLGSAYLRYSFTKGTRQEVDHVVAALGLMPGAKVLDVGCGPGRHAHELARRGIIVHGIDISEKFVALATAGAPPAQPSRGWTPATWCSILAQKERTTPSSASARARSG